VAKKSGTNGGSRSPANRRKTGGKLRNGLDPAIGKATRFQPGQSGNPTGRPKNLLSDASRDWLKRIDEKTGKTNAELVAEAQGKVALEGDTSSYCAIRDTTEGRPAQTQQHEIVSNDPVKVQVEAPDLIAAIRQIYGLTGADSHKSAAAKPVPKGVDSGQVETQDRD